MVEPGSQNEKTNPTVRSAHMAEITAHPRARWTALLIWIREGKNEPKPRERARRADSQTNKRTQTGGVNGPFNGRNRRKGKSKPPAKASSRPSITL
jgi:hypothetical protein